MEEGIAATREGKVIDLSKKRESKHKVITKIVDGKPILLVDVDAMTPEERERYFAASDPASSGG